jgi:SAM-dependent methyltransferase
MTDPISLDPAIRSYYDLGREQSRLETWCRTEFVRTSELLDRFLPPAPARVLDVGGGSGVYATPLMEDGYDVVLVDPVALHVEQALGKGVEAEVGDARKLQFGAGSFDAVLLLGPLYHLPEREDRLQAIKEARRVAGPTGLVVAALISRFASSIDGLMRGFLLDDRFEEVVVRDIASGRHENPDATPGWFTTAYFHDPLEVSSEFEDGGCRVDAVLAIEGIATSLPDADSWLDDPDKREVLLRAIRRTEAEPSLLGASSHLFVVSTAASDETGAEFSSARPVDSLPRVRPTGTSGE